MLWANNKEVIVSQFNQFNLPQSLNKSLELMDFSIPTPIQLQAIPVALQGKDIIGCAQTGTGKTAAFCIPMLVSLLNQPEKNGLILVPTRELAQQIEEFWKKLIKFSPRMPAALLIGGVSMGPQFTALKQGCRVVIATPGRLIDHLNRGSISLKSVSVLVLDEADRMLDMGFAPQLERIARTLTKERQTFLFSATTTPMMERLSKQYLSNPVMIRVGPVSQAAPQIEQLAVALSSHQFKNQALLDEVNSRQGTMLIFARTQIRTDRVARFLNNYGLEVGRIHGGRSQAQRNSALTMFRGGKTRILVATDVASRGIDVKGIAHVINYDLPETPEDYIHRIGRTARAGAAGKALSFLTPEDKGPWKNMVRFLTRTGSQVPKVIQSQIATKA